MAPESSQTTDDLPTGTMVGEYRVAGKLGEGGMGSVYAAEHPLIGKKAAIKVIRRSLCTDHTAVERFIQEARAVNQIGHPNIVDVFAFGQLPDDARCYFVMEWLQGESLADRLQRGVETPVTLVEVLVIWEQIADALEAAHEKGIMHRDLKPENVFLVPVRGGRQLVKLLDFGLAKLQADDNRIERTRTGMMMGTPAYISPEQARGKNVDARTDIYALGAMGFEMMTGRLPFEADNAMELVAMHLQSPPPMPSSIWPDTPPRLDALVVRMLDKVPANRPSLAEIRTTLQDVMEQIGGARPSSFMPRMMTPLPSRGMATPQPQSPSSPAPASASAPAAKPVSGYAPTIASSVSDIEPGFARKSRGWVIGVGALVLVAGVAVVAVRMIGGKSTPAPGPAPEHDPPAEASASAPVSSAPAALVSAPSSSAAAVSVPVAVASAPASSAPEMAPASSAPEKITPGQIDLKLNVPAKIELDGRTIADAVDHATIPVDQAGDHRLVVSSRGRKTYDKVLTVEAGARLNVSVHLDRADSGTPTTPVVSAPQSKPAVTPTQSKPAQPPQSQPKKDKDYVMDPFGKQP